MPDPIAEVSHASTLLRRRRFRVILGVAGVVIVLPTLVYAFGGPGAREVDRTSGPRSGLRGFRLVSDGAGLVELVRAQVEAMNAAAAAGTDTLVA